MCRKTGTIFVDWENAFLSEKPGEIMNYHSVPLLEEEIITDANIRSIESVFKTIALFPSHGCVSSDAPQRIEGVHC